MKNRKLYYFFQFGTFFITFLTAYYFTLPYLVRERGTDIVLSSPSPISSEITSPKIKIPQETTTVPIETSHKESYSVETAPGGKEDISGGTTGSIGTNRDSLRVSAVAPSKPESSKKLSTSYKKVTPLKDVKVESSTPESVPQKYAALVEPQDKVSNAVHAKPKPTAVPFPTKTEEKETKPEEGTCFGDYFTLECIEHFFKITSSIIGTIFPLIGFAMSYILWKERRKEQKTQSV